eukprot:TRINITY_DN8279_c0_g1_i2.p1 TRINITY_DN8279_c0_g1~~TRINITY_DN8279_c0_g1_i2.p1  ORF type:complete len:290 (+),score=25.62 TRINITY_DN8279_c0_g1_i2:28-870(+)
MAHVRINNQKRNGFITSFNRRLHRQAAAVADALSPPRSPELDSYRFIYCARREKSTMCWSESVSWWTFAVGTALSIFSIAMTKNLNIKAIAYTWQFAIFMQLTEAIIWRHQANCKTHVDPNSMCSLASRAAYSFNILQPIASYCILVVTSQATIRRKAAAAATAIVGTVVLMTLLSAQPPEQPYVVEEKGHLNFPWWFYCPSYASLAYLIPLATVIYNLIQPRWLMWSQLGLIAVALMTTHVVYRERHVASLWCWVVAFAPITTLAIAATEHYLNKPKLK